MESITIQFLSPRLWWWILLAVPSIAVAFWAYYRILAPLSRPARWSLWLLRGLAFLLVLFALGQPVLTAVFRDLGEPDLALLRDRSASMSLPSAEGADAMTRGAVAEEALGLARLRLEDRFRLHAYDVSGTGAAPQSDSLPPGGNTALGRALEDLIGQTDARPVSGILLVSDGVNTVGPDPVRVASRSPVPIFTVAVGSPVPPPDVEIRRVRTNPTAFAGEPLPVQIVLSSSGFGGKEVEVVLTQGERELARQAAVLVGDFGLEQEVTLELRPEVPGLTLYDLRVEGVPDSVPENNRRQVAVEVLERKTRILVVSGRLDWDLSFLKRTLSADTTLAYAFLVSAQAGRWMADGETDLRSLPSRDEELRDFAAVLLLGFGDQGPPATFLELLSRFVRQGGGLFLLGGPSRPGGWATTGPLAGVLPGSIATDPIASASALPVAVTLEGQRHPVTAIRENPTETAQGWAELPPLWRIGGDLQEGPAARRLLEYRSARGPSLAALVVGFHERGKVAWLYGQGIWRWGFRPSGSGVAGDFYEQFALGLTRWLAEPAVRERFQVVPGKRVYQNGESMTVSASLWNENYQPVAGAEIEVTVVTDSSDAETGAPLARLDLRPGLDAGRYDVEGPALQPGAYRFSATARDPSTGQVLGRQEGQFWVEEMGPEFARTAADPQALAQVSRRSGGRAVPVDSLDILLESLPDEVRRVGRVREVELWNHWGLFLAFVLVLSVEWFLRRRRGLA